MSNDSDMVTRGLRAMPTPEPRPGFVDRALANATGVATSGFSFPRRAPADRTAWRHVALRWETWFGAVLGGAVAAVLTVILLRPVTPHPEEGSIAMAVNEARDIDVLIQSDQELPDATIRIAVTGGVTLDGFSNEHIEIGRAHV